MRVAYICETSFHLFQCVRYVCHNKGGDAYDLFLNKNADTDCGKSVDAEGCGLFEKVVRFDQEAVKVNHAESIISGISGKYGKKADYSTLKKKIAFAHFVKRALSMTGGNISGESLVAYDRIMAPAGTGLTMALSVINPGAEIIYYEDGIGGYYGDMFVLGKYFRSLSDKLSSCGIDPESLRPSEIMVSYPESSKSKTAPRITKMDCGDSESTEIRNALHAVFGSVDSRIYADNKIVYFSPLTVGDNPDYEIVAERNKKLCADIDSVCDGFVIRPHPKEKNAIPETKNGFVDMVSGQWEMTAMEQIGDEHILVGGCSTAQLTPKLLFDKEPRVIFTYDELFGETGIEKKEIADVMNILLEMYRDKSRVLILKRGESIADALAKLISGAGLL